MTSHYRTPVGPVAMVIVLHRNCFGYRVAEGTEFSGSGIYSYENLFWTDSAESDWLCDPKVGKGLRLLARVKIDLLHPFIECLLALWLILSADFLFYINEAFLWQQLARNSYTKVKVCNLVVKLDNSSPRSGQVPRTDHNNNANYISITGRSGLLKPLTSSYTDTSHATDCHIL